MVTTSWGWIWSSTSAFWSEDNTPKSPQPGHQSGSTFPLKSASVSLLESGSTTVAMCPPHLVLPIPLLAEEGRRESAGVVSLAKYCAGLTTPSAPLRWLRGILLMAQPPLLCEEGNITRPWLRSTVL